MIPNNLEIYCDFDGTVTLQDVTDALLEKLAAPAWREIEAEWEKGLIGSRDCMSRQVELIRGGWSGIFDVLQEIDFDPSFKSFVAWCHANEIPVTLVSDGLDMAIKWLLDRENIKGCKLIANQLRYTKERGFWLNFVDSPSLGAGKFANCSSGVCKCMVLARAGDAVQRIVIGDGRSDFCWADRADVLYAKKSLLTYAKENDLDPLSFSDFDDIRNSLQNLNWRALKTEKKAVS